MSRACLVSVPVWDLPTRLFHWLLAALVAALWISGELGKLETHMLLGKLTLTLILFRLIWGIIGSASARFASFVKPPAAALAYLRTPPAAPLLGHNPLGAYSVLALLGLLSVQSVSGLFTSDDIFTEGPLAAQVSAAAVKLLSTVHRLGFKLLLVLLILHVGAVLFYLLVKKDNLVRPMVTGHKEVPAGTPGITFQSSAAALAALALAAAVVWGGLALA